MKIPTPWSQSAKTAAPWSASAKPKAAWSASQINPGNTTGYLYDDASRNFDDINYQYDYSLIVANSINQSVPTAWSST